MYPEDSKIHFHSVLSVFCERLGEVSTVPVRKTSGS